MPKPMHKLRVRMMETDIEREDCVKAIGCSTGYWSERMMERRYFDLGEVYTLCDLMKIPYEQIPEYFPRLKSA